MGAGVSCPLQLEQQPLEIFSPSANTPWQASYEDPTTPQFEYLSLQVASVGDLVGFSVGGGVGGEGDASKLHPAFALSTPQSLSFLQGPPHRLNCMPSTLGEQPPLAFTLLTSALHWSGETLDLIRHPLKHVNIWLLLSDGLDSAHPKLLALQLS